MNRLDRITTRTGDDGTSALADGTRLPKSAPRFIAMGEVDELNAHLGALRAILSADKHLINPAIDENLTLMQHHLFEIGSELAVPGMMFLQAEALDIIERWAEKINADLPPLQEFILPAGCGAAAQAHICRTVARRAERALVALNAVESLNHLSLQYLNRCSDVLFIVARVLNRQAGVAETHWRGNLR